TDQPADPSWTRRLPVFRKKRSRRIGRRVPRAGGGEATSRCSGGHGRALVGASRTALGGISRRPDCRRRGDGDTAALRSGHLFGIPARLEIRQTAVGSSDADAGDLSSAGVRRRTRVGAIPAPRRRAYVAAFLLVLPASYLELERTVADARST